METCEDVGELARELGERPRCLYKWRRKLEMAQTLVSEVGLDMSRWKTYAHFASWLGLCPDNRISGDQVLARGTRHVVNRAATALRMGASTLLRSQTYLGVQYRRLRSKRGAPKAITAMAQPADHTSPCLKLSLKKSLERSWA